MLKIFIKNIFQRFGYQLVSIPNWSRELSTQQKDGYVLSNYGDVFDYQLYKKVQESGNIAKIDQIWTNKENLEYISNWISSYYGKPEFILCHGTRNGFEQRIFKEVFDCHVIGTEISSTADQFPMTIQADFHKDFPEWENKVDFIYSNSLDHAYDPKKALKNWASCLKKGGYIVLDKASDSDPHGVSDLDPFGISLPSMLVFILTTLGENFSIRCLLNAPNPKAGTYYHRLIFIQRIN